MTDDTANVDADVAFEFVQIVAVGFPAPRHAFLERHARDRFDTHETLDDSVFVAVIDGRQRQAAVAHDDRSYTMLRLAGTERIPENLPVHMGVMINESRRYDEAIGVDRTRGRAMQPAHLGNFSILNADVSDIRR